MQTSRQPTSGLPGEIVATNGLTSSLPLEHVEVQAQVVGMLASVAMVQRFSNPMREPVELLYRFAIPHRASLAELSIRISDRAIDGDIVELEEAEALYREAIEAGKRAALATEERPNLYTVQIGNVQPGEGVVATYRYSVNLDLDGGAFELAIPFGVVPRYHRSDESTESAGATDVAIAPAGAPVADLDVSVAIDAGMAIEDPVSPSHRIEVTRLDARRCTVRLVAPRVPNKDFVVRYRVDQAVGQIRSAVWRDAVDGGELIYALFVPPVPEECDVAAMPREYVFVLDRSGSMSGNPIAQARNALRACLRTLSAEDTFRILLFDNECEWFSSTRFEALPFGEASMTAADRFLSEVEGRGGTELLAALEAIIALPPDPRRQRVCVVLTDGAISAEQQVVAALGKLPSRDRLFCFGIGPSVNRYLLDRLARAGRGVAEVVGLDEDIEGAIIRFQDRLSYPLLTDLRLEVGAGSVVEVYPSPLPDLYAGQSLQVVGRLAAGAGGEPTTFRLLGRRGSDQVVMEIDARRVHDEPLIRRMWAQQRIDSLLHGQSGVTERETIVRLSREFHVLTPFTALIAVDQVATGSQQKPHRLVVAAPLPEGVTFGDLQAPPSLIPMAKRSTFAHAMASPDSSAPGADWTASLLRRLSPPAPLKGLRGFGAPSPASPSADVERVEEPPLLSESDRLLRELIRQQRASGAWGDDAGGDSAELTAAAIVAFARAGHTPNRGIFRRPLKRAFEWLKSQSRTPSDRVYLWWARGEIAAADGDLDEEARVSREVSARRADAKDAIGQTIVMRLNNLTRGERDGASGRLTNPRIAAIIDGTLSGEPARDIPLPWRACLQASGRG